ncbi:MAG: glycosyltransferase [Armatimonadota bacterium]
MRVLVLVNGDENSAMGLRAQVLFGGWEQHEVHIRFRQQGRGRDAVRLAREVRALRPDVVVLLDLGATNFLGWLFSGRRRPALITLTGDDIYGYQRLVLGRGELVCRAARLLEDAALRRSAMIGVRGTFHKKDLEQRGYANVRLLTDHVDLEVMRPAPAEDLRAWLGLTDMFVVGLVGTVRWNERWRVCYGWDLVEALALVEQPSVRGLIVGGGDGLGKLRGRSQDLGVADRLVFTGPVPPEEVYRYINAMDACLSTQTNNAVGWARTTIKLPEYLACGKYVIATDVGEASLVLPEIGSLLPYAPRVVRDEEYPARLAAEIDRLAARPELTRQVRERARQVAEEEFDVRKLRQLARAMAEEAVGGSR